MDPVDFDPSIFTSYELVEIQAIIDNELQQRSMDEQALADALEYDEEQDGLNATY